MYVPLGTQRCILSYLRKQCRCWEQIWSELVPFAQFKKSEKHPQRTAEAYNFTKSNTLPWVFSRFLDCTNGAKSWKASHIYRKNFHKRSSLIRALQSFANWRLNFITIFCHMTHNSAWKCVVFWIKKTFFWSEKTFFSLF